METIKKNKIYNVIILDKSGSMSSITKQAIDGTNETLAAIRSSQLKDPTQDNYVTLVAFCGCELRTIFDNVPIAETRDITSKDYQPCCMTPLYDAVGRTITKLHPIVAEDKTVAAVTIITDGYENASREYSGKDIKALIESYKNEGWMFAYIGTDHDVEAVAASISINNTINFNKTPEGTRDMFAKESSSRGRWLNRISERIMCEYGSAEERHEAFREASQDYFDV